MKIGLYIKDILYATGGTESYTVRMAQILTSIYQDAEIYFVSECYDKKNVPANNEFVKILNSKYGTKLDDKSISLLGEEYGLVRIVPVPGRSLGRGCDAAGVRPGEHHAEIPYGGIAHIGPCQDRVQGVSGRVQEAHVRRGRVRRDPEGDGTVTAAVGQSGFEFDDFDRFHGHGRGGRIPSQKTVQAGIDRIHLQQIQRRHQEDDGKRDQQDRDDRFAGRRGSAVFPTVIAARVITHGMAGRGG